MSLPQRNYGAGEDTGETTILSHEVFDLRFPTSLSSAGSDAMHGAPDYSAAYIVLRTNSELRGHGFSFTIGRGNDLVCQAAASIAERLVGKTLAELTSDMGRTWRMLVSDSQYRWLGPEKGVTHLALSACVNALWDLWGRAVERPVWRLISDMTPEDFVRCIDFRYIEDAITREEAIALLKAQEATKPERLKNAEASRAVPAYSTEAGWLGYSDDKMRNLMKDLLATGHDKFKLKVGRDLEDDKRRCRIAREMMGEDKTLMVDANQVWGVKEAIEWMIQLAEFKPVFIEEPTSPDDVLGHAAVRKALRPYGIGVATGEMCQNRVIFKQLMQAEAIDVCQIDACRLGGVNEVLAVLLMAAKFGVPIVPHSGGIGLNEYTQHLSLVDYLCVAGKRSMLENITTFNHALTTPLKTRNGFFVTPLESGYSVEFKGAAIAEYRYPDGTFWRSEQGLSIIDGRLS